MLPSRQEAFCRGLTEGLSQYEAYQKAGYRSEGRNAIDANCDGLDLGFVALPNGFRNDDNVSDGDDALIEGDATRALGAYQGSVYNVRRAWAKEHERELIAFVRAIVAAHDVIFTDKTTTIAVLRKRLKELSEEDAAAVYAKMTGPGGLSREARISIKGAQVVLSVRSAYGEPQKKLADPYRYVDLSWYRKATGAKPQVK